MLIESYKQMGYKAEATELTAETLVAANYGSVWTECDIVDESTYNARKPRRASYSALQGIGGTAIGKVTGSFEPRPSGTNGTPPDWYAIAATRTLPSRPPSRPPPLVARSRPTTSRLARKARPAQLSALPRHSSIATASMSTLPQAPASRNCASSPRTANRGCAKSRARAGTPRQPKTSLSPEHTRPLAWGIRSLAWHARLDPLPDPFRRLKSPSKTS